MLKFDELRKVDLAGKTKKLDGYDYLPWLACLELLYANGAEDVQYDCTDVIQIKVQNQSGPPANNQVLVKVYVEIDGKRRSITHPVALGEFSTNDPTVRQIEAGIQRAFVKCVAINWGLGLDLWAKADGADVAPLPTDSKLGIEITMAFGAKVPEFGSADALHKALGSDKAFLAKLIQDGSKEDQQAFLDKINRIQAPNNGIF